MSRVLLDAGFVLLLLNGLRVVLGVPPVSYWFRSRSCPTCNGVGHVRKVRSLKGVSVTRNGETTEIDL